MEDQVFLDKIGLRSVFSVDISGFEEAAEILDETITEAQELIEDAQEILGRNNQLLEELKD